MSGLACGLIVIVIVPLARSRLLGGLIQFVLAELDRPANCHIDIANELFRYLDRNLDHETLPFRYLELSKLEITTTGPACQGREGAASLHGQLRRGMPGSLLEQVEVTHAETVVRPLLIQHDVHAFEH
jgi:hypothetical protein